MSRVRCPLIKRVGQQTRGHVDEYLLPIREHTVGLHRYLYVVDLLTGGTFPSERRRFYKGVQSQAH